MNSMMVIEEQIEEAISYAEPIAAPNMSMRMVDEKNEEAI